MRLVTYLGVRREEGELERPAVLDAAGDHAREEEPDDAHRRLPGRIAVALLPAGDGAAALEVHGGPVEALACCGLLAVTLHGRRGSIEEEEEERARCARIGRRGKRERRDRDR